MPGGLDARRNRLVVESSSGDNSGGGAQRHTRRHDCIAMQAVPQQQQPAWMHASHTMHAAAAAAAWPLTHAVCATHPASRRTNRTAATHAMAAPGPFATIEPPSDRYPDDFHMISRKTEVTEKAGVGGFDQVRRPVARLAVNGCC
jgi:hypothetical protein